MLNDWCLMMLNDWLLIVGKLLRLVPEKLSSLTSLNQLPRKFHFAMAVQLQVTHGHLEPYFNDNSTRKYSSRLSISHEETVIYKPVSWSRYNNPSPNHPLWNREIQLYTLPIATARVPKVPPDVCQTCLYLLEEASWLEYSFVNLPVLHWFMGRGLQWKI